MSWHCRIPDSTSKTDKEAEKSDVTAEEAAAEEAAAEEVP